MSNTDCTFKMVFDALLNFVWKTNQYCHIVAELFFRSLSANGTFQVRQIKGVIWEFH